MFKVVFLVHKRSGMSFDEFRRHWRETQGSLGAKIPGTQRYVQNHTVGSPDGSAASYDGFAEMWFDSKQAFEQAMTTPEAQAAIADLPNFLDTERMETLIVDEVQIV
jgi:uncharacterized protein (TIGR02118 family)